MAVENFLQESSDQPPAIPEEILQLERKLSEPVRVHNDDKLRRQKLKQQKTAGVKPPSGKVKARGNAGAQQPFKELAGSAKSLELKVAFSKLTVQDTTTATNREPSDIRKAKASDLPPLEHVFAEGLYFTLADIVLLPCVHHFLVRICLESTSCYEFQFVKLLRFEFGSASYSVIVLSKFLTVETVNLLTVL